MRRPRQLSRWIAALAVVALASCPHGSSLHAATISVNGDFSWESFGYPDPETTGQRWENFLAASLRGRGELPWDLSYEFDMRVVADDVEFTAGFIDVRNSQRRRPYFAFREALLSYRLLPDLRLSAGKQLVQWSVMEGLQPANLMYPRDESDPFRQWSEGVYSVGLHYDTGNVAGEVVVVPIAFTPSRLPQGRWQIIPGDVPQIQELPPVQFDETQVGGRLRVQLGEWNGGLLAYAGRSTEAIFVPQLIFVGGDEIFRLEIVDRYPHLYAFGTQVTRPIGDSWLWRVEAVYYHSPDPDQDDLVHTTTGIEYTWESWRAVLSYLRQDITAQAPEEVTDPGALQFFRSFLFGELRYDPGKWSGLQLILQGGHDFTEKFTLFQPEVSAEVYRNVRLTLEGDLIAASAPSYFDSIRHNDRIGARIEYFF